jgi:hypothetical protein
MKRLDDRYDAFMERRHRLEHRTYYALRTLGVWLLVWAAWAFSVFLQYL